MRESTPNPNAGVYRSVYQSAVVGTPADHPNFTAVVMDTLTAAHADLVSRAAATRMNPMTRKTHVQAAADLIAEMAHE